MTKALILQNIDKHTVRLIRGLKSCNIETLVVRKYNKIPTEKVDITFIDPSLAFDPSSKINSDITVFYDCEDDPYNFKPSIAYDAMKNSISFYAKMNWIDDDRKDNIKNIGFPLEVYLALTKWAKKDIAPWNYKHAIPFFIGNGTYLGSYKGVSLKHIPSVFLGEYKNKNTIEYMYHQRYHWLISLRENNVPYLGGLVFNKDGNLSRTWQNNYFKGILNYEHSPVRHEDYLKYLLSFRVGLCPSGHDRLSWRLYDIMATGSILILTDTKNQQSMYMPKSYITISDEENLSRKLLEIQPEYNIIWKAHQENREILAKLTPNRVWNDFISQMI